jgi:hypothetical protein
MKATDELTTWNTNQSWNARQHFATADGRRLRADIRRNAYDFQSSATLSGFDPAAMSWNVIASLALTAEAFPALSLSYVRNPLTGSDMVALEDTVDALLAQGRMILGEAVREPDGLRAAGDNLADLLEGAIDSHIYDHGEEPANCPYRRAIATWRALEAGQPTRGTLPRVLVTVADGIVQSVVADRPAWCVMLDYDIEGQEPADLVEITRDWPETVPFTAQAAREIVDVVVDPDAIERVHNLRNLNPEGQAFPLEPVESL